MLENREATFEESALLGLKFRISISSVPDTESAPLVVLIHGRSGNASLPWIFSSAVAGQEALVIAPEAGIDDPEGGKSWWLTRIANEELNSIESSEIENSLQLLDSFIDRAVSYYRLNKEKILLIGFSQGASLATMLSINSPDKFLGVAALSGFIPRAYRKLPKANFARTKYFIYHGRTDAIVPYERGVEVKEQLASLKARVHFVSEELGHKVGSLTLKELKVWCNNLLTD